MFLILSVMHVIHVHQSQGGLAAVNKHESDRCLGDQHSDCSSQQSLKFSSNQVNCIRDAYLKRLVETVGNEHTLDVSTRDAWRKQERES